MTTEKRSQDSSEHMKQYGKKMKEHEAEIEAALGCAPVVIYSAYKCGKDELPINNLAEVPFRGKMIIVECMDEFWDDGVSYISPIVENPTWLELAVLANRMINVTGDTHHTFFEGIERSGEIKNIPIYSFIMGS